MHAQAQARDPTEAAMEATVGEGKEAAKEAALSTDVGREALLTSIELARRLDANDDAQAVAEATRALDQAERCGDTALLAQATDCLALCQVHQGVFGGALENVYRAIGLWRQRADLAGEAGSRALHAQVLLELGEVDEALEEAKRALQLADSAQDARQRAGACMVVGFVYRTLGHSGDARSFFEQAMAWSKAAEDRWLQARALCNLGNIHCDLGGLRRREGRADFGKELLKALDLYHQSLHFFKELGDARLEGNSLRNIALVHGDLGDHAGAAEILAEQLARARETGSQVSMEMALRLTGKVHLDRGEHQPAVERLSEAVAMAASLGRLECEWLSHQMLSQAHEAMGDTASALHHFKRFHVLHAQAITERNEHRGRAFALQYQTARAKADAEAQRLRASVLEHRNLELEQKARTLSDAALEDALTGLYNRRQLDTLMQVELRQRGQEQPFSIAMVDIDFFKRVNDTFSHQVGDLVLRQVGQLLRRCCRQGDVPIRYGGEEFSVVFLGASTEQAARVCERIRAAVQKHNWATIHTDLSVTVSIGLADNQDAGDPAAILSLADKRLYAAKQGGRNRVVSEGG